MKSLYVIDYWIPFPQSEYGGLITLIAENDQEAFEILSAEDSVSDDYPTEMMNRIINAQKFNLVDDYESGVIDAFLT